MNRMIRYEWEKIWQGRLTQITMAACVLFFLFSMYANMSQVVGIQADGTQVQGMEGIRTLKQNQPTVTLTQEEVDRMVKQYLDYTKDPKTSSDNVGYQYLSEPMYRSWYLPKKELLGWIEAVYRPEGSEAPMKEIFEKNLGKDIFQARLKRDQEAVDRNLRQGKITDRQAAYWKESVSEIREPLSYGYCEGWKQIFFAGNWAVIIMMVVGIGVAPIFAGEYQSKCDSLFLCMKYGKNRLVTAKLLTAWLYTTFVYLALTAGYSAGYLLMFGAGGGDLPVQMMEPLLSVGYTLTIREGVVLVLVLGYVFTLCFMAVTLFLSSILKNSYGVVVITLPLVFVLALLSPDQGGYVWSHILSLLPSQIVNFVFHSYTAYTIFGKVFHWISAGIMADALAAAVLVALSYKIFRDHQVNK